MNRQQFIDLVKDPNAVNFESAVQLEALLKQYPYCQAAQVLLAYNYLHTEHPNYSEQLKKAIAYAGDRKKLKEFLQGRTELPSADGKESFPQEVYTTAGIPETFGDRPSLFEPVITESGKAGSEIQSGTTREEFKRESGQTTQEYPRQESASEPSLAEPVFLQPMDSQGIPAGDEKKGMTDSAMDSRVKDQKLFTEPFETESVVTQIFDTDLFGRESSQPPEADIEKSIISPEELALASPSVSYYDPADLYPGSSQGIKSFDSISDRMTQEELLAMIRRRLMEIQVENRSNESRHGQVPQGQRNTRASFGGKPATNTYKEELIDRFIREEPQISKPKTTLVPTSDHAHRSNMDEEELVSETLALLYARQGNIHKAIHIYDKLSLLFSEKSRYFAAQIENLKKIR